MKNYAFIKDSVVVNIAVFEDDVTEETLDLFKKDQEADLLIETDENAYIGGDYIDGQFRSVRLFDSWSWDKATKKWVAPIPMPEDNKSYDWSEETQSWMVVFTPNE